MKKQFEQQELIIDRSKWRTGIEGPNSTGLGDTQLLNPEGHMCCLGFFCQQVGVPKKKLLDQGEPDSLSNDYYIPYLLKEGRNTSLTHRAIAINDDYNTTPKEKEQKLKELFKSEGIKVRFIGRYPKKTNLENTLN